MKKSNNKNKEIRSINSDENLYNEFQLEQLEERLEMGGWLCGADCGENCTVNCGENCVANDICVADVQGGCVLLEEMDI